MNTKMILLPLAAFFLLGCQNRRSSALLEKENELLRRELELAKKESAIQNTPTEPNARPEGSGTASEKPFDYEAGAQDNVIYWENKSFTIRVDITAYGQYRYFCWNKPKKITDQPDMEVYCDGCYERSGSGGNYSFTFPKGEWTYVVQYINITAEEDTFGPYLSLYKKDGKENSEYDLGTLVQRTAMKEVEE